MRPVLPLVVLLLLVPAGSAQTTSATVFLEDAAGDVKLRGAGGDHALLAGWATMDLLGLDISEDHEHLILDIHWTPAGPVEAALLESSGYYILFRHGAVQYAIFAYRELPLMYPVEQSPADGARLLVVQASDQVALEVADLETELRDDGMSIWVPRTLLIDEQGAPPVPGRQLEGWHAWTTNRWMDGPLPYAFLRPFAEFATDQDVPDQITEFGDRMPDEGNATSPYAIRAGGGITDGIAVSSPSPFRYSNGEATTVVFRLEVYDLQGGGDTVALEVSGLPAGWTAWFPESTIDVPALGHATTNVLVQVPFQHVHGARQEFEVHATGQGTHATTTLGVVYPEIPQPAGHHAEVFLHSSPDQILKIFLTSPTIGFIDEPKGFLNTLPDDESDSREPIPHSFAEETGFGYWFPLMPELTIGIDVDETRTGRVTVPLQADQGYEAEYSLTGALLHMRRGQSPVELATTPEAPAQAVGSDAPTTFVLDLVPTTDDAIPFVPGDQIGLLLRSESQDPIYIDGFLGMGAKVMPGGSAILPLEDYHDDIEAVIAGGGLVHLTAPTPERPVNPGETVVFELDLHNADTRPHRYAVQVRGTHAEWATVVPAETPEVGPGRAVSVVVAVAAAEDARHGDIADLIVEAVSQSDGEVRALAHIVARVDTRSDHPDEGALSGLDSEAATPSTAILALVLALALIAGRRRSRL